MPQLFRLRLSRKRPELRAPQLRPLALLPQALAPQLRRQCLLRVLAATLAHARTSNSRTMAVSEPLRRASSGAAGGRGGGSELEPTRCGGHASREGDTRNWRWVATGGQSTRNKHKAQRTETSRGGGEARRIFQRSCAPAKPCSCLHRKYTTHERIQDNCPTAPRRMGHGYGTATAIPSLTGLPPKLRGNRNSEPVVAATAAPLAPHQLFTATKLPRLLSSTCASPSA